MRRLIDWLFGRRLKPAPVRVVVRLTVEQALDVSLRYGYHAVPWEMVG